MRLVRFSALKSFPESVRMISLTVAEGNPFIVKVRFPKFTSDFSVFSAGVPFPSPLRVILGLLKVTFVVSFPFPNAVGYPSCVVLGIEISKNNSELFSGSSVKVIVKVYFAVSLK
ncbi:hypothetical protein IJM86_05645 [bacterium]|nr:hypothetical protein [bacterium]